MAYTSSLRQGKGLYLKLNHATLRYVEGNTPRLQKITLHKAMPSDAAIPFLQGIEKAQEVKKVPLPKLIARGITLTGADFRQSSIFKGSDLRYSQLQGVRLSSADLRGAHLAFANLNRANLNGANLTQANLRHAFMNQARLENVNFSEATLTQASMKQSRLAGSYFYKARLGRTNMAQTDLSETVMSQPQFKELLTDASTVAPKGFTLERKGFEYGQGVSNLGVKRSKTTVLKRMLRDSEITQDELYHLHELQKRLQRLQRENPPMAEVLKESLATFKGAIIPFSEPHLVYLRF
ncbi:MAG: pentapeptide repeat-containing protein [Vampirovibrionales bacterium]